TVVPAPPQVLRRGAPAAARPSYRSRARGLLRAPRPLLGTWFDGCDRPDFDAGRGARHADPTFARPGSAARPCGPRAGAFSCGPSCASARERQALPAAEAVRRHHAAVAPPTRLSED